MYDYVMANTSPVPLSGELKKRGLAGGALIKKLPARGRARKEDRWSREKSKAKKSRSLIDKLLKLVLFYLTMPLL
jgi:hypothetical protein